MRFYRTTYEMQDDGARAYKWAGSQSEAASQRKEARSAFGAKSNPTTEEIDVPTGKVELLAWLNANATAA